MVNDEALRDKAVGDSLVYEQGFGRSSNFEWLLFKYDGKGRNGLVVFSPVLNQVAEAVFYARHAELGYRKIQPAEASIGW
ncbi:hypothetical protein QUB30_33820 [Microcoleus sp. BROC3]